MQSVVQKIEEKYKKRQIVDVRSGDNVKVHQKIREGGRERIQIFEGLVIRVTRKNSLSASITVRRISSGVGVEKTYLLHSPLVLKIEVIKRSKVRRNYLTYMRRRSGKSTRLIGREFDKDAVNVAEDDSAKAEEEKLALEAEKRHETLEAKKAEQEAKAEAKAQAALAAHKEAQPVESQQAGQATGKEKSEE